MKVTKIFHTETAHRLADHVGLCKNIHGHTYRWEVTIIGEVGASGMVIDFADLKNIAWGVISIFDHALVLHNQDPLARILSNWIEHFNIILIDRPPTAEVIAYHAYMGISDKLKQLKNPSLMLCKIKLWETPSSFAEV